MIGKPAGMASAWWKTTTSRRHETNRAMLIGSGLCGNNSLLPYAALKNCYCDLTPTWFSSLSDLLVVYRIILASYQIIPLRRRASVAVRANLATWEFIPRRHRSSTLQHPQRDEYRQPINACNAEISDGWRIPRCICIFKTAIVVRGINVPNIDRNNI